MSTARNFTRDVRQYVTKFLYERVVYNYIQSWRKYFFHKRCFNRFNPFGLLLYGMHNKMHVYITKLNLEYKVM